MKANDFLKDFIGDDEIVEVKATSLKKMLIDNERLLELLKEKDNLIKLQNIALNTLKQQIMWEEAKKPRFIDIEA